MSTCYYLTCHDCKQYLNVAQDGLSGFTFYSGEPRCMQAMRDFLAGHALMDRHHLELLSEHQLEGDEFMIYIEIEWAIAGQGSEAVTPAQLKTVQWLANGEVGLSSKQLAMWIAFDQRTDRGFGIDYPKDPDDFDRCLKFLERVPEARPHLYRMAELSPIWKALVERWDDIEKCQLDEIGLDWCKARSAPKTYALMQSIIGPLESRGE